MVPRDKRVNRDPQEKLGTPGPRVLQAPLVKLDPQEKLEVPEIKETSDTVSPVCVPRARMWIITVHTMLSIPIV